MGNGMNKVLPGLYIGNYRDSKDGSQLDKYCITHILAIHDSARRVHADKFYLCIMASDSAEQNLTQYFPICNDFIHAARLRNGNVLIHCLAGMSRSVTVAVAYIMSVTNLTWKEALKVVRAGRSVANPNLGFQAQLEDFETNGVAEERRRLKERYPSLALKENDITECYKMLNSYKELLENRTICEGSCSMGEQCPTGICRLKVTRRSSRRPSTRNTSQDNLYKCSSNSDQSDTETTRSWSGPAGLLSYTGSAPLSRSSSRSDVSLWRPTTAPSSPARTPAVSPVKRRGSNASCR